MKNRARWGLICALAATAAVLSSGRWRARLRADEPATRPVATSGILTADGWVFPHYGLTRPSDDGRTPWELRRVGSRVIGGRALDVYRYARADVTAGGPLSTAGGFAEADLVDPLTGERVGGLVGDLLDATPPPASSTCALGR